MWNRVLAELIFFKSSEEEQEKQGTVAVPVIRHLAGRHGSTDAKSRSARGTHPGPSLKKVQAHVTTHNSKSRREEQARVPCHTQFTSSLQEGQVAAVAEGFLVGPYLLGNASKRPVEGDFAVLAFYLLISVTLSPVTVTTKRKKKSASLSSFSEQIR